jgi:predicted DNA-binding protein
VCEGVLDVRAGGRLTCGEIAWPFPLILSEVVASTNLKFMMAPSQKRKIVRKVGRPPAGDDGERVKDYPQVSFRLPIEARDKLVALSQVRKQPQWRLIVESVECYLRDLPRREQAQIARLLNKRARDS